MKKCLITGSTGLIGSALVQLLDQSDWQIYATVRSTAQALPANITPIPLDLAADWNSAALPSEIDAVIHLAQSERFREFPAGARDVFQVNVHSTFKLLEYARQAGARTFILASSGGIYGNSGVPFAETDPITPSNEIGFYLSSKACADLMTQNYAQLMNIVILRFFFVYGPGQRSDMLIPRLVGSVKEGRPIILYGQNGIRINPTYVGDAALAVQKSLELTGNHKINVAGPEVLDMRTIGQIIGQVVGKEPLFECRDAAAGKDCVADIGMMQKLLVVHGTGFREGIMHMIKTNCG